MPSNVAHPLLQLSPTHPATPPRHASHRHLQWVTKTFPSKLPSPNSSLNLSPQLQQASPQKPRATPTREAGSLTADLHLPLLSSKSRPPAAPPALQTICYGLPFLSAPFPWVTQILPSNLPSLSSCYTNLQFQQTFPGKLADTLARKASGPVKDTGEPGFSTLLPLLHIQSPVSSPAL